MKQPRHLLACLVFFLLASAWGLSRQRVDNLVYFGGDSWEYQSMAVNALRGHGLREGQVLPFPEYKLSLPPETAALQHHFEERGRDSARYNTYRTPAFPALAWLLYAVFGPEPRVVYRAQVLLLALCAASLPLLGRRVAGASGFVAGVVSGLLLMITHARVADTFLTEVVILTYVVALSGLFPWFQAQPTPLRAATLGLAAGAGLLVKGSLVFIPPLLGLWIFGQALRKRFPPGVVVAAALGMAGIPQAWSGYVSSVEGKPVFVSTQGNAVLLEGNNELCFPDGGWHWEYSGANRFWSGTLPDTTHLYYNQPDVRPLSVGKKLVGFYTRYAGQIPKLWLNKLGAAYADLWAIRLWAATLVFLALRDLVARRTSARRATSAAGILSLSAWLLLPTSIYAVTGLWVVAGVLAALWLGLAAHPESRPVLPALFWIIPLNFILLTVLIFGLRRFTLPADPVVWLATGLTLIHAWKLIRNDFRLTEP